MSQIRYISDNVPAWDKAVFVLCNESDGVAIEHFTSYADAMEAVNSYAWGSVFVEAYRPKEIIPVERMLELGWVEFIESLD